MHEYSFRWTPSEYVRASHAITRHTQGTLPLAPMLWIVSLILFLGAAGSIASPAAAWTLFAIATLSMALAAYLRWGRPWQLAQRIQREDPSANQNVRHIVTNDGFCVRSSGVSTDIKWAHITQVVETKELLLYYVTKRAAYFTPKRVIASSDLDQLRSTLRELLGDRVQFVSSS